VLASGEPANISSASRWSMGTGVTAPKHARRRAPLGAVMLKPRGTTMRANLRTRAWQRWRDGSLLGYLFCIARFLSAGCSCARSSLVMP
jgi:hypothetical protein